jgi:hypothetical protein
VKRPRKASREAYMAWIARAVSEPGEGFLLVMDEGALYGAYILYREGRLKEANRVLGMTLASVYTVKEEEARRLAEKVAVAFGVWREIECVETPPIVLAQLSLLPYDLDPGRRLMPVAARFLRHEVVVLVPGELIWGEEG